MSELQVHIGQVWCLYVPFSTHSRKGQFKILQKKKSKNNFFRVDLTWVNVYERFKKRNVLKEMNAGSVQSVKHQKTRSERLNSGAFHLFLLFIWK